MVHGTSNLGYLDLVLTGCQFLNNQYTSVFVDEHLENPPGMDGVISNPKKVIGSDLVATRTIRDL